MLKFYIILLDNWTICWDQLHSDSIIAKQFKLIKLIKTIQKPKKKFDIPSQISAYWRGFNAYDVQTQHMNSIVHELISVLFPGLNVCALKFPTTKGCLHCHPLEVMGSTWLFTRPKKKVYTFRFIEYSEGSGPEILRDHFLCVWVYTLFRSRV